jgi:hypothetical protein
MAGLGLPAPALPLLVRNDVFIVVEHLFQVLGVVCGHINESQVALE